MPWLPVQFGAKVKEKQVVEAKIYQKFISTMDGGWLKGVLKEVSQCARVLLDILLTHDILL